MSKASPPAKSDNHINEGYVFAPIVPNVMEVFVLGLCAWNGISGLATWVFTGVVPDVRLHHWLAVGWLTLLAVGGLAGVVGCFWPDPILGGLVLRAALWPVAGGALTAGTGSAWLGDWSLATILILFAMAAALRAVQINIRHRHLLRAGP
jgi:hypothetical protein